MKRHFPSCDYDLHYRHRINKEQENKVGRRKLNMPIYCRACVQTPAKREEKDSRQKLSMKRNSSLVNH